MRCQGRGFTLIELLVAVIVISILVSAAVPTFTTMLQNYRMTASANQLYYYLQYARSESIKRNTNIYVSFNTGSSWCYGVNIGSACTCTTANSCGLATVSYAAANQQTLSTTGMTSNSIYFEGSHSAASASSSVTLTQYGQTTPLITISIGRMGNMTTCSTGISGYTAC